jgi:ATP-binding cassette, subfamily B, bacterial PglK
MRVLLKLINFLSLEERKQAGILVFMAAVMAIIDVAGVVSIMPFIAVVTNPDLVQTNDFLNSAYRYFDFSSIQDFQFAFGGLVFVGLLVSLVLKALTNFLQLNFILMREYTISKGLVQRYLAQRYIWFTSRNSSDIGKVVLSEVSAVTQNGFIPLMTVISQGLVVLFLIALLMIVDVQLATIIGLTLSIAYLAVYKVVSRILGRLGIERLSANKQRFKVVGEAFGGYKEVKSGGLEDFFIHRFISPSRIYAGHQAVSQIVGQLPRYLLEGVTFGGMLLLILYLLARGNDFIEVLPIVALYAVAGYRLLPALQNVYRALTQLRFIGPAVDALHADWMLDQKVSRGRSCTEKIKLEESLRLKNISYGYPGREALVLKNVSVTIKIGKTVGVVGESGSGKTTLVDLIQGLLEPTNGEFYIDGKIIALSDNTSWKRLIGYVPQKPYLADATLAENIAFGIDPIDIDIVAVERAAKLANLHEFVTSDLPDGYDTNVGERGVRFSGGQLQRVAIARALYHDPQILLFDEATGALDKLTENNVMDAVKKIGGDKTVIVIAHRLSAIQFCDEFIFLVNGEVAARGTFDELVHDNKGFRALI